MLAGAHRGAPVCLLSVFAGFGSFEFESTAFGVCRLQLRFSTHPNTVPGIAVKAASLSAVNMAHAIGTKGVRVFYIHKLTTIVTTKT